MKQPFILKPYGLAWRAARPFLRRHRRLGAHFAERLVPPGWPGDLLPAACALDTVQPPFRLWIHAASGGEAYLAREIVARLAPRLQELAVVCTSMTEQGVEILAGMQREFSKDNCLIAVNYFPLDEPGLMLRALRQAFGPPSQAPRAVVLLETEIWPGLLWACRQYQVRSYILNGRMTEGSFKAYQRIAGTLRAIAPNDIMATTGADAGRFRAIFDLPGAPSRVSAMPNIKFDRLAPAAVRRENPLRGLLGTERPQVLLFASVREEEEPALARVIAELRRESPQVCIVVAPRHLHRAGRWSEILRGPAGGGGRFKMRSQGLNGLEARDLALWDAFGDLTALYGLATACFVGGSLADLGGQNFLEPLAYGVAPVIGPSWSNFYWVGREPFDLGLVRQVPDEAALAVALLDRLRNPPDKERVKKDFAAYLEKMRGGAEQAAEFLIRELWGD